MVACRGGEVCSAMFRLWKMSAATRACRFCPVFGLEDGGVCVCSTLLCGGDGDLVVIVSTRMCGGDCEFVGKCSTSSFSISTTVGVGGGILVALRRW